MTRRLLLSYAAFAVVLLIALEVPLAILGAHRYHSEAIDQDENVATALAVAADGDLQAGHTAALQNLVQRYRTQTGGEVAICNASGVPVASFDPDHDDDARTTDQPFVHRALTGAVNGGIVRDEGEAEVIAAAPTEGRSGSTGAVVVSVSASNAQHRTDLWWALLIAVAVVALACALGLGWWLSRTVTRPLARLGLAVQAFGQPDLGVRADEREGPAEVVALARQFNQMADQLRELVDAQNRFVADASHQLRSPLAALRLRIENLEADHDPARSGTIEALDAELQRLSRLVDGLINLGNAGTTTPDPVPVALDTVVRERAEVWSALASEREVSLDVSTAGEPWTAPIGEGDLDQILDNLLANALEASPFGSEIAITVTPQPGGGAAIRIADDGPGMTDEQLSRAFDRFWRGGERSGPAGGLGLAIVRQLAVRNGLVVDLARRPKGGLDATVRVPRARRQPATRSTSGR